MPFDPVEPLEKKRVQKGGSFLCTDQYCTLHGAQRFATGAVAMDNIVLESSTIGHP
jgi:hypothetical protein